MRLYGIVEEDIEKVIKTPDTVITIGEERISVMRILRLKFKGFPLKVIYTKEHSKITVISAYPLKKVYRR